MGAIVALAAIGAAVGPVTVAGAATTRDPDVLYSSLVTPLPGNLTSLGFEANQASEFGNQVVLTKAANKLQNVVVTLSSWGCQSGSWTTKNCVTTPGAKFSQPITLNIYNVNATDSSLPGTQIVSLTDTFRIPYRPSTTRNCAGTTGNGGWGAACNNGKAANITFTVTATLPQNIVFGVAYNTSDYGSAPYGDLTACHASSAGCPYDSLNVALSQDPTNVTKGSDPNPGTVFWNTLTASDYCDGGGAGTPGAGIFRLDSPGFPECWIVSTTSALDYVPAVQFNEN